MKRSLAASALGVLAACAGRFSAPSASGDDGPPFEGQPGARTGFGLVSLAPASDEIGVRWRLPAPGATGFALFLGTDPGTLLDGAPLIVDPPGESITLAGLATDTTYFLALGQDIGGGAWRACGPVLTARTGLVIYVDPEAAPGGDGSGPDQPLNNLLAGILTAFASGGGNVWVARGTIAGATFSLPDGVDLYGGFEPGFDLAARDPSQARTLLAPGQGADALLVEQGSDTRVLDGLWIDGTQGAKHGVDVDGVPVELRSLSIDGASRGIRIGNSGGPLRVEVVACRLQDLVTEGMTAVGAFDLYVDGSTFSACGQEGLDLDDLVAPDGETIGLTVRESLFRASGEEGLDCDLAAPAGGVTGGSFVVSLLACDFVENGASGALIDLEYESEPLWSSSILVDGCLARRNGGHGLAFDLDARSDVLVRRVACIANGSNGLAVTSESHPGVCQVDSSLFLGNDGRGVRASLGNFALLLSNSVLAGNHGGGLQADTVEAAAVSSVAYLQPNAYQGALAHASVVVHAADLPAFENAPLGLWRVEARDGNELTLASTPTFAAGAVCELDGDELAREALAVSGKVVELESVPDALPLPATLASFAPGGGVLEDYRPSAASLLLGAGLASPGGAPTDAGPFGASLGGAPGAFDAALDPSFFLSRVTPRIGLPLDGGADVVLQLTGFIDAGTLNEGVSAVDAAGAPLAIGTLVDGEGRLVLVPPGGGWPNGSLVRLHRGLRRDGGGGLAAEVVFRLVVLP